MIPDQNWKETRLLAEDISLLLGIPTGTVEDFFHIIENLICHKFLESLLDNNCQDGDYQIELPYLGSLVISLSNKHMSTSFTTRNAFFKKLKSTYSTKQSPLISQISKLLGEELSQKYREGSL